jgi:hypothetical protein
MPWGSPSRKNPPLGVSNRDCGPQAKGGREKKVDGSGVHGAWRICHLPQPPKNIATSFVLYFVLISYFLFLFFHRLFLSHFGRFVTMGVQKHGETQSQKSI